MSTRTHVHRGSYYPLAVLHVHPWRHSHLIWEIWMPTLRVALPPVFSPQRLTLEFGRRHWIAISFWTRLRHVIDPFWFHRSSSK
jgi:hypothetical protein